MTDGAFLSGALGTHTVHTVPKLHLFVPGVALKGYRRILHRGRYHLGTGAALPAQHHCTLSNHLTPGLLCLPT
jgi:hypothetical protein